MKALENYTAKEKTQLSFKKGDILELISKEKEDWWMGSLGEKIGYFPSNTVVEVKVNLVKDKEIFVSKSNDNIFFLNGDSPRVFYIFFYFLFIIFYIFIF